MLTGVIAMRVGDIMTRPAHTVRDTDTIEDAAALLTEHAIAAPVLDETGTLVGIVSDTDLLWRRVPGYPNAHPERAAREAQPRPKVVAEVRSPHPLTTTPLTEIADVADVARYVIHHDVRSIPVLDHRRRSLRPVLSRSAVRWLTWPTVTFPGGGGAAQPSGTRGHSGHGGHRSGPGGQRPKGGDGVLAIFEPNGEPGAVTNQPPASTLG